MLTLLLAGAASMNFSIEGYSFSIKGSQTQLRLYFSPDITNLLFLIKPLSQTDLAYDGVLLDNSIIKQIHIRNNQKTLRQDVENRRDINLAPGILHWIGSTNYSQGFKLQPNKVYEFMVVLNVSMDFSLESFNATGNYHTFKSNNREDSIDRNLGLVMGNISNKATKQNNYSTFVYKNIIAERKEGKSQSAEKVYLALLIKPQRSFKDVAIQVAFLFDNNFFVNQDLVIIRKNFTIVDLYSQSLGKELPDTSLGGKQSVQIVDYFFNQQVYYLIIKRPLQSNDIFFDESIYKEITPICFGFQEFNDKQKVLEPSKLKIDCAILKFAALLGSLFLLLLMF